MPDSIWHPEILTRLKSAGFPFDCAQGGESFDAAQDRESFDSAQDREPVERPVEPRVKPGMTKAAKRVFHQVPARSPIQ